MFSFIVLQALTLMGGTVTTSGREIGRGFVRYLPTMKQGASVGLPGMRADHK